MAIQCLCVKRFTRGHDATAKSSLLAQRAHRRRELRVSSPQLAEASPVDAATSGLLEKKIPELIMVLPQERGFTASRRKLGTRTRWFSAWKTPPVGAGTPNCLADASPPCPPRVKDFYKTTPYFPEPFALEISVGSSSQSKLSARAVVSIGFTSGISSATDVPSSANFRADTSTRFSSDPTAWL